MLRKFEQEAKLSLGCLHIRLSSSDVKSSRPKWPPGRNFGLGLGLEALASASASRFWPRPGLNLVVLLCNRAFFVKKSCKIREFC